ncbi:MAG: hypothetical protein B6243_10480, partial [Anaerolineaceae bacterium 4572_5.2]
MSTEHNPDPFNFLDVTAHFNPAWFASVMGTAVIPLAISFIKHPLIQPLAIFFTILSVIMFLVALIPWTLKFFLYPENAKKDFKHPIAANFFPAMPISLIIFSLNLLKYPTIFFAEEVSQ